MKRTKKLKLNPDGSYVYPIEEMIPSPTGDQFTTAEFDYKMTLHEYRRIQACKICGFDPIGGYEPSDEEIKEATRNLVADITDSNFLLREIKNRANHGNDDG